MSKKVATGFGPDGSVGIVTVMELAAVRLIRLISAPESYKARSGADWPSGVTICTSTAMRSCFPLLVGSSCRRERFATRARLFPAGHLAGFYPLHLS